MGSTVERGHRPGRRKLKWIVAGSVVLDGCYLMDGGYLDLVDGWYDRELGYPYQIGNVPQPWIPDNCGSTLLLFPAERDWVKRLQVIVTELTPLG